MHSKLNILYVIKNLAAEFSAVRLHKKQRLYDISTAEISAVLNSLNGELLDVFKTKRKTDTCNGVDSGLYTYLNFDNDKKGAPEGEARGTLLSIAEIEWPSLGTCMYQIFISWDAKLYARCWISGESYGTWHLMNRQSA